MVKAFQIYSVSNVEMHSMLLLSIVTIRDHRSLAEYFWLFLHSKPHLTRQSQSHHRHQRSSGPRGQAGAQDWVPLAARLGPSPKFCLVSSSSQQEYQTPLLGVLRGLSQKTARSRHRAQRVKSAESAMQPNLQAILQRECQKNAQHLGLKSKM